MAQDVKNIFISYEDMIKIFTAIATKLDIVYNFFKQFPTNDNQTFGIMNRKPEPIAGAGMEVLARNAPTAASLALNSLEAGYLVAEAFSSEEMLNEVAAIVGEERFNKLMEASVASQKERKVKSPEQRLAEAMEAFDVAMAAKSMDAVERGGSSLDVEQSKTI